MSAQHVNKTTEPQPVGHVRRCPVPDHATAPRIVPAAYPRCVSLSGVVQLSRGYRPHLERTAGGGMHRGSRTAALVGWNWFTVAGGGLDCRCVVR